jgi:hypothetical protein
VATQVEPSAAYLERFESPLWELLDLDSCKPVTIIEGRQEGFHYTVIEMQHLSESNVVNNATNIITTFVAIALPERVGTRHITHRPTGHEASASGRHVFLADVGRRVPPGRWRAMIASAIEVTGSLRQTQPGHPPARTYDPSGSYFGSIAVALGCLMLTVLFAGVGLGVLLGLIKSDSSRIGMGLELLGCALFTLIGAAVYYDRAQKRRSGCP